MSSTDDHNPTTPPVSDFAKKYDKWNELATTGAFKTIFRLQSASKMMQVLCDKLYDETDDPNYALLSSNLENFNDDACALTDEMAALLTSPKVA